MRKKAAEKRTAAQLRERGAVTEQELQRALGGLLRVSVEVLRSAGVVRTIDVRWFDDNVRFRKEI